MSDHPELGPLKAGDRVALVSPSGPVPAGQLDRAVAVLTGWGLEPVVGEHASDAHPRAKYLAGDDKDRAADLQQAWCDDSLQAVFCIRGGYGAVRILDFLDAGKLRAAGPKILLGSSDATALHEYWAENLEVATWFTPMIATDAFLNDEAAREGVHRALFTGYAGRTYRGDSTAALFTGQARGVLTGGTLSLLAMTLGARGRTGARGIPSAAGSGRIGLLEDVTEDVYRLDGLLQSLLRAGWFEGMAGIALGSWSQCDEPAEVKALMEEVLGPLGIPLLWELGFGHGAGAHSIPLGVSATLYADTDPRLVLD